MLGLLRRAFSSHVSVSAKRSLYVSLVRSKLLFCSPLWHPYLLKDVKCLELVQIRATRFIINNPTLDYKDGLIQLNILPLMMEFEIAGIPVYYPSNHFNIYNFIEFSHHNTRASSYYKLKHPLHKNSSTRKFYFNRIPRLWISLPPIDIRLSISTIKKKLRKLFGDKFITSFDSNVICTYHYLCPCVRCCRLPVNMHFNHSFL